MRIQAMRDERMVEPKLYVETPLATADLWKNASLF